MRILFLDDEEWRHERFKQRSIGHEVDHVYSVKDAIYKLNKIKYDVASLDHDLGGKILVTSDGIEPTGFHVAQHIAGLSCAKSPTHVVIHSYNVVGANNMKDVLSDKYDSKHLHIKPFGQWFPNEE